MRSLFVLACLAALCSPSFAGTEPAIAKAYADSGGAVHIVTADHRDHAIRPRKWQSGGGFEDIQIAPDRKTVGWLADQMLTPLQCSSNYPCPVALELDIWKAGRVVRRFHPPALGVQNWIFLKGGNEVAFHVAPLHGQEFYDCALFGVNTGKRLAHWALDRRDFVVPEWAKPLLVDDPLPGPDEISTWVPDSPTPTKNAAQPKP